MSNPSVNPLFDSLSSMSFNFESPGFGSSPLRWRKMRKADVPVELRIKALGELLPSLVPSRFSGDPWRGSPSYHPFSQGSVHVPMSHITQLKRGYEFQQIFESDVKNPQKGTFTNPCFMDFPFSTIHGGTPWI